MYKKASSRATLFFAKKKTYYFFGVAVVVVQQIKNAADASHFLENFAVPVRLRSKIS